MAKITPHRGSAQAKHPPSIALPKGNYYGLLAGYSNVWQRGKYQKPNEKVDVITVPFLVTHDAMGNFLPHFARVSKIVENKITYWEKNNVGSALAQFYSILQNMNCQELVKAIDAGGEEYIPNLDDFIAFPVALSLDSRVAQAKPEEGGYAYEVNSIKDWMPAPQAFVQQISEAIQGGQLVIKESQDKRRYLAEPKHASIDYIVENGRVVDVQAPSQEIAQRAIEVIRVSSPAVLAIGGHAPAPAGGGGGFGGGQRPPAFGQGAPAASGAGGFGGQTPAPSNQNGFARPAPAGNGGFGGGQPPQQHPPQQQAPQSNVAPFQRREAPAGNAGGGFSQRAPVAAAAGGGGDSGYSWPEVEGEVPF